MTPNKEVKLQHPWCTYLHKSNTNAAYFMNNTSKQQYTEWKQKKNLYSLPKKPNHLLVQNNHYLQADCVMLCISLDGYQCFTAGVGNLQPALQSCAYHRCIISIEKCWLMIQKTQKNEKYKNKWFIVILHNQLSITGAVFIGSTSTAVCLISQRNTSIFCKTIYYQAKLQETALKKM
jgi:hypothetical protein